MTRFPLMLLVVALVWVLAVAGCGSREASPKPTGTPEGARSLSTATAVPAIDRKDPGSVPSEDQRPPPPPKKPLPYFCSDFDTWREANEFFIAAGGPERDPYGLDSDGDGTPCEELRPPKKPLFCHEFDNWQEASAVFKTFGGPENDPFGMDPDGDGIPCETLREQKPDG